MSAGQNAESDDYVRGYRDGQGRMRRHAAASLAGRVVALRALLGDDDVVVMLDGQVAVTEQIEIVDPGMAKAQQAGWHARAGVPHVVVSSDEDEREGSR